MTHPKQNTFLDEVDQDERPGLMGEFVGFMRENAKWWLTPILLVFGLLAAVLLINTTGFAPFIYSLW